MLHEARVVGSALVQLLVLGERAKVFAEAVADEREIARHVIDNRAEARQASGHNILVVLQYQLDSILLQLSEERFARVLQ